MGPHIPVYVRQGRQERRKGAPRAQAESTSTWWVQHDPPGTTATRGPGEQRDQPDKMDPLVHPVTSVRSGLWERLGLRGRGESGVLRETLEMWAGQEGLISRVREDPRETWDRQERPDLWPQSRWT